MGIYRKNDWDNICVVGLGNHALKKLLPAILKIYNSENISIVTSKSSRPIKELKYFSSLEESLNQNIGRNCIYYLATPPAQHYSQARKILSLGIDVIIEKPAFIFKNNLIELIKICESRKVILIEAMMYLQNNSYYFLRNLLATNKNKVIGIETVFTIPELPLNSFRNEQKLSSSLLCDMGCYPFSLLASYSTKISDLNISLINKNKKSILYNLSSIEEKFYFMSKFGLSNQYINYVKCIMYKNHSITISPFYYGRKSDHKIVFESNGIEHTTFLNEEDAFVKLLKKSRQSWIENQSEMFRRLLLFTDQFEKLGSKVGLELS